MKETLEKIQVLKSNMRSVLEKAETEKRNLTEDEQKQFDTLKEEKRMLEFKLECESDPQGAPTPVDVRAVFLENATDAVNSGKSTRIDVRAASAPIDSSDVADTIPVLQKDILEALEPALVVDKLGIKMQTNVQGEPMWPTVAGVEATIADENDEISDSTLEFGKIKASPKRVSVSIPVSRRAFNQSNLDLYGIVTKQLGKAVARTMNKWLLSAPKALAKASPSVFVKKSADIVDFAGATPTFKEIVSLETKVLGKDVIGDETGAYVMTPAMYGLLKSTVVEAGSPKMILEDGTLNGYPVVVTNQMLADSIGFGFFSYAVISQFGAINIVIDPYTGAKKNIVNFVLNGDFDITVLRPEAFSLGQVTVTPDTP